MFEGFSHIRVPVGDGIEINIEVVSKPSIEFKVPC
jgi:hypothetical protein